MSLRDKILFFGIIIALFIFVLFGFIFPAEDKLKSDNPFIKLKSPEVACSTLENFINMVRIKIMSLLKSTLIPKNVNALNRERG